MSPVSQCYGIFNPLVFIASSLLNGEILMELSLPLSMYKHEVCGMLSWTRMLSP